VPAPINVPLAVLSGSPFGDTHPVNPTAETANAKVKTCSFIIQKSILSDNQRHSHIQKSTGRGRWLTLFPRPLLFPKTVGAAKGFSAPRKFPTRPATNKKFNPPE
jgi:hypothetical protein